MEIGKSSEHSVSYFLPVFQQVHAIVLIFKQIEVLLVLVVLNTHSVARPTRLRIIQCAHYLLTIVSPSCICDVFAVRILLFVIRHSHVSYKPDYNIQEY